MTKIWDNNRPLAAALLVWIGGSLLFFLAVHLPLSGPASALNERQGFDEMARHYEWAGRSVSAAMPFDDARAALEKRRVALDAALSATRACVEFRPGPEFTIKSDETQKGVEYTKIQDRVTAALRELANKAGIAVPADFDPRPNAKDLPGEAEAGELLIRLAMTDRVVRAAAAAHVTRVASVTHTLSAPRGAPLAQRTLNVKLVGGLDAIVRFIEKCSMPPVEPGEKGAAGGILTVRTAEIASVGSGASLTADIELAAITVVEVKPKPHTTTSTGQPAPRARRSF